MDVLILVVLNFFSFPISNLPEELTHNPETMALLLTRDLRSSKHLHITVGSDSHSKQLCSTSSEINGIRLYKITILDK